MPENEQSIDYTTLNVEGEDDNLYRYIDRDAGVVIYAGGVKRMGMEIIPIEETDLD